MESLPLCLQTQTLRVPAREAPLWSLGGTWGLSEEGTKIIIFSPNYASERLNPQRFGQLSLGKPDSSSRADALHFDGLYLGVF